MKVNGSRLAIEKPARPTTEHAPKIPAGSTRKTTTRTAANRLPVLATGRPQFGQRLPSNAWPQLGQVIAFPPQKADRGDDDEVDAEPLHRGEARDGRLAPADEL